MIRCVIVDDEPLAIEIIEAYLARIKGMVVVAKFNDPVEAFTFVQNTTVDILFLDLNMPLLSGLDLLKNLKQAPRIIITTAYREYAVESFELDVVDYLVKPFSFSRFLKAVNKASNVSVTSTEKISEDTEAQKKDLKNELWVKVDKKIVRIMPQEIFFIESLKDYVRIVTAEQKFVTYQTLNSILTKLPDNDFIRIHKSYIVQVNKIKSIDGNVIHIKDEAIPIGRSYRQDLLKRIEC